MATQPYPTPPRWPPWVSGPPTPTLGGRSGGPLTHGSYTTTRDTTPGRGRRGHQPVRALGRLAGVQRAGGRDPMLLAHRVHPRVGPPPRPSGCEALRRPVARRPCSRGEAAPARAGARPPRPRCARASPRAGDGPRASWSHRRSDDGGLGAPLPAVDGRTTSVPTNRSRRLRSTSAVVAARQSAGRSPARRRTACSSASSNASSSVRRTTAYSRSSSSSACKAAFQRVSRVRATGRFSGSIASY